MKITIFLLSVVFLFVGCAIKEPKEKEPKTIKELSSSTHFYPEEFIYKKEQIDFFEKEFNKVKDIKDKELLKKYILFYEKNGSYFINSDLKVEVLKKKLTNIDKINENSQKYQLTKALSISKNDAIKIYEKLAKEGNIFAMRELADINKYNDKVLSIFWYEKLVENNDIQGIKDYAFANLHMVSPITIQNVKKAVSLYEKLDSLGEISGLVYLGNIYEYGYFKDEFPIDKQKAFNYFKKASDMDYTPAQKKLAKIYLCKECNDNRYNESEGIKLLEILASKEDEESINLLKKFNLKKSEEAIEQQTQKIEIKESAE